MELARPQLLYLLLLLPLVAVVMVVGARRRKQELDALVGESLAESLAPGASWRRSLQRASLQIAVLALMVVAAAGPRFGTSLVKMEREGIDLVIALDTSLSMLAEDMKPNRLERAKREIIDFMKQLRGDRVGIVVFAGDASVLCPLTVDYDAALMLAGAVGVEMVSAPGTAIGKAIAEAAALFETSQRKDKAVILVTDGESHEGNPVEEARRAAQRGIRIYPIGIGSPAGELIPLRGTDGSVEGYKKDKQGQTVLTRLDEVTLERIAEVSGGKYLPATREGIELKVLYNEIAGMEKKKIKGEFVERKKERFQFFLAAALAFLSLEWVLPGRARQVRRGKILHTGLGTVVLLCILAGLSAAKSIDGSKVKSGNRYYQAGAYDRAMILYREALGDSAPSHPPRNYRGVLYNIANTFYQMGKPAEALRGYQAAAGEEDTVLAGRTLYNRGNALMKMGRFQDAAASYLAALRYMPDDDDVLYNLELALRRSRRREQQNRQQEQGQRKEQGEQGRQEQQQGKKGENEQEQNERRDKSRDQWPDSTRTPQPQREDSLKMNQTEQTRADSNRTKPPAAEERQKLTKEDALRLLMALEEEEKRLQREKKRAAFKKVRRKGKDW